MNLNYILIVIVILLIFILFRNNKYCYANIIEGQCNTKQQCKKDNSYYVDPVIERRRRMENKDIIQEEMYKRFGTILAKEREHAEKIKKLRIEISAKSTGNFGLTPSLDTAVFDPRAGKGIFDNPNELEKALLAGIPPGARGKAAEWVRRIKNIKDLAKALGGDASGSKLLQKWKSLKIEDKIAVAWRAFSVTKQIVSGFKEIAAELGVIRNAAGAIVKEGMSVAELAARGLATGIKFVDAECAAIAVGMAAEAAHPWITAKMTLTNLDAGRSKLIHKEVKQMKLRAIKSAFATQSFTTVVWGAKLFKMAFSIRANKARMSAKNCIEGIWNSCQRENGCVPRLYYGGKWRSINKEWDDLSASERKMWWGGKDKETAEFKCDKSGSPLEFECNANLQHRIHSIHKEADHSIPRLPRTNDNFKCGRAGRQLRFSGKDDVSNEEDVDTSFDDRQRVKSNDNFHHHKKCDDAAQRGGGNKDKKYKNVKSELECAKKCEKVKSAMFRYSASNDPKTTLKKFINVCYCENPGGPKTECVLKKDKHFDLWDTAYWTENDRRWRSKKARKRREGVCLRTSCSYGPLYTNPHNCKSKTYNNTETCAPDAGTYDSFKNPLGDDGSGYCRVPYPYCENPDRNPTDPKTGRGRGRCCRKKNKREIEAERIAKFKKAEEDAKKPIYICDIKSGKCIKDVKGAKKGEIEFLNKGDCKKECHMRLRHKKWGKGKWHATPGKACSEAWTDKPGLFTGPYDADTPGASKFFSSFEKAKRVCIKNERCNSIFEPDTPGKKGRYYICDAKAADFVNPGSREAPGYDLPGQKPKMWTPQHTVGTYTCNDIKGTCDKTTPGKPGGITEKKVCEKTCLKDYSKTCKETGKGGAAAGHCCDPDMDEVKNAGGGEAWCRNWGQRCNTDTKMCTSN